MTKINYFKILPLICLFFAYAMNVYSQNMNIQMPLQEDINKMNKKIYKQFAKTECYNKSNKYMIYHRYHYRYNGIIEKTDFENMSFLTKLNLGNQKYHSCLFSKSYPRTRSYICDSDGKVIAIKNEIWQVY